MGKRYNYVIFAVVDIVEALNFILISRYPDGYRTPDYKLSVAPIAMNELFQNKPKIRFNNTIDVNVGHIEQTLYENGDLINVAINELRLFHNSIVKVVI